MLLLLLLLLLLLRLLLLLLPLLLHLPHSPSITCSCDCTRKAPIFFLPPVSGSPSTLLDKNLMIGMKIPPARAVVEGRAGDTNSSATSTSDDAHLKISITV